MSKDIISIRTDEEFKRSLQVLAHEYRMGFSDLVREILEQGATRWQQALDEEKAGPVY